MGLRSKVLALREDLQERLIAVFEREIRGARDCVGILSCTSENPHVLSGHRLDQNACQVRHLSNRKQAQWLRCSG